MSRNIACLLVLFVLSWSMGSVAVGQETSDLSGTLTVTATSVAAGIGWSWGSGTLTLLDGSQHQFKVGGVAVVAGAGATSMRNDKGVVINLTSVGQGIDFRLAVSGMDVKLVK